MNRIERIQYCRYWAGVSPEAHDIVFMGIRQSDGYRASRPLSANERELLSHIASELAWVGEAHGIGGSRLLRPEGVDPETSKILLSDEEKASLLKTPESSPLSATQRREAQLGRPITVKGAWSVVGVPAILVERGSVKANEDFSIRPALRQAARKALGVDIWWECGA